MADLPSYEEAVHGGYWLDLIAPYVAINDYARLCRVSRAFYERFAARLWNDPLQMIRHLGLRPDNDLDWYLFFATRHARTVRSSTRRLVASLDFRGFAVGRPSLFAGSGERSFSDTLRHVVTLFPAVRCILLDGHAEYDPAEFLSQNLDDFFEDGSKPMPLMLSLAHCGSALPNVFFTSPYWRQLVYLDISHVPGLVSIMLAHEAFRPANLPQLRILKMRGRDMQNETVLKILTLFHNRIWSYDLSNNNVTDDLLCQIAMLCFTSTSMQSSEHFEKEGQLVSIKDQNGEELAVDNYGRFSYVAESSSSGAFSHPNRYFADTPGYLSGGPRRLNGREKLRKDSADTVKSMVAGESAHPALNWHHVWETEVFRTLPSLTHIHLSGNSHITVQGIDLLFNMSRGYLESFDCSAPTIPAAELLPGISLVGILGRSHLFRPVIASNLRSLRIHHSLVTRVPTLTDKSKSNLESLNYAETVLRERAKAAYPTDFVPDLNPRLESLTLTCLPRVSTGPLIDDLIGLLRCAHEQEISIRRTGISSSHRSPLMLRGLRHIRLEFEPLPTQEDGDRGVDSLNSLDAAALLQPAESQFSFFNDSNGPKVMGKQAIAGPRNIALPVEAPLKTTKEQEQPAANMPLKSIRLAHYPLIQMGDTESEYIPATVCWMAQEMTVPVWVGSGVLGPKPAINAYMKNLECPSLRKQVRPATPDQMKAGVPIGVCVFSDAWDAIVLRGTGEDQAKPKPAASMASDQHYGMRDVVQAIRRFRAQTKTAFEVASRSNRANGVSACPDMAYCEDHQHWTGTLEVMLLY